MIATSWQSEIWNSTFSSMISGLGWVRLVCRIKAYYPLVGPGPVGGMPSVRVFLNTYLLLIPSSYPIFTHISVEARKFQTARSTSTTGDWIWHLPTISFEHRIAASVIGPMISGELFNPFNVHPHFSTDNYYNIIT